MWNRSRAEAMAFKQGARQSFNRTQGFARIPSVELKLDSRSEIGGHAIVVGLSDPFAYTYGVVIRALDPTMILRGGIHLASRGVKEISTE